MQWDAENCVIYISNQPQCLKNEKIWKNVKECDTMVLKVFSN